MSKSDSGAQVKSVLGGRLRIDYGANRLIVADNDNVDILLAGVDDNGQVVVKLAPPGVDVKSAPDDDLVWSSNQRFFKIVGEGTFIVPAMNVSVGASSNTFADSTGIAGVKHDLGYKPKILAFAANPSFESSDGSPGDRPFPYQAVSPFFSGVSGGGLGIVSYSLNVTDGYIFYGGSYTIHVNDAGFAGSYPVSAVTVRYQLLKETAQI